jgi:transcriptional antiterminator RfaH
MYNQNNNSKKKWLLIQYKPNSYHKVQNNLSLQGFESYLPFEELSLRKRLIFEKKIRPAFPGYMFVSFDPFSNSLSKIKNTYGVSRIVTSGNKPIRVSNDLILDLKERFSENGNYPETSFKSGDCVKISNGPFVNFIANIDSLDSNRRIWALIDMMGQKTKVHIKSQDVKSLS